MKLKKRYKDGLKSWLDGLSLELERVKWDNGFKLYRIYYIEGGSKRYLGLFRNSNYYYHYCSTGLRVCFNMLLISGLKSRIEKL
jgi:hypothetical protein